MAATLIMRVPSRFQTTSNLDYSTNRRRKEGRDGSPLNPPVCHGPVAWRGYIHAARDIFGADIAIDYGSL